MQCAGAAAVAMNPSLAGRVFPFEEYMKPETEATFSDEFFSAVDCVTNALDNVKARLYVDARCVSTRTALLEPGTLGPKGHVQVIVPGLSESYGSAADPEEEDEIPFVRPPQPRIFVTLIPKVLSYFLGDFHT